MYEQTVPLEMCTTSNRVHCYMRYSGGHASMIPVSMLSSSHCTFPGDAYIAVSNISITRRVCNVIQAFYVVG